MNWELKKIKFPLRRQESAIKTGPFGSQVKSIDFKDEGVNVYNQRNVLDDNFEQSEIMGKIDLGKEK